MGELVLLCAADGVYGCLFILAGATCFFAYLYVRPLIRRGLGSASRHVLNCGSMYNGLLLVQDMACCSWAADALH